MSLDELIRGLPCIKRGDQSCYPLKELLEALILSPQDRFPVEDGICLSLFCILPNATYELYAYEFDLLEKPDPEKAYRILAESEMGNKEPWHERLRRYSPIFVKDGTQSFSKNAIVNWINYVLSEPEIKEELHSLFGEGVTADDLYICTY